MSDKYNKEEESLLQKIQNKTGCLFLVIGVAMLAFVLTDLVGSGSSIFGSSANTVGSIGGEEISYDDYNNRFEAMKQQIMQNNPGFVMSEDISKQYRDQAWSMLVQSKTTDLEYEKLGIDVGPAELEDLTIGNNTHPQIQQSFNNPETGQFEKQRLIRFLKEDINQDPNAKASWLAFQDQFVAGLKAEKYNKLIGGSFYATELEAKYKSIESNKTINASVVALPYVQNADSSITVSDNEIMSYAKERKEKYKQKASRDIEYVKIDVVPSKEDSAGMLEWGMEVAEKFKSEKDDSSFVSIMSSETPYDPSYKTKENFPPSVADLLFSASKGTVLGPYQNNGMYSVYKITGIDADTAGAKTIQVAQIDQAIYPSTKTDGESYKIAGELLTRVNKDNSFESVVENLVLAKRVAGKVTESNPSVPGLRNPSKLTRWLFEAETSEGDLSPILDMDGSYVVAHLVKINEEGLPSAADLRAEIEPIVKNRKLGEKLKSKVEDALASASSADALAKALGTTVTPLPATSFGAGSLPYIGQDEAISGAIFGVPVGSHSDVLVGRAAVAVVYVNNENAYEQGDLAMLKLQMKQQAAQEARGLAGEALREKAEVIDQRYRFYD